MAQRIPWYSEPPAEEASPQAGNSALRAETCRSRAADARQLAEVALDPAGREAFLKVAAQWDHMADQLQRRGKSEGGRVPC